MDVETGKSKVANKWGVWKHKTLDIRLQKTSSLNETDVLGLMFPDLYVGVSKHKT